MQDAPRQPEGQPPLDPSILTAVFQHAIDGIFLADAGTGILLQVNPAGGRLVGREPRELAGRHQSELHPPDEAERYAKLFAEQAAASAARPTLVEGVVRHADGRDIPVSIHVSLWQRDGRRIVQGIFRDLSSQQATLRVLDHERSRLLALIRTIPDLVWLKDPAGRYLACNPAFERLYGLPEAKLLGRTDYDFVDTATAEFFRDHDRRAAEAGRPTRNEEWLTFRADGQRGLFETIKTPMRDSSGRLIGVLGVARDITDLRRAQSRLEHLPAGGDATAAQLHEAVAGLQSERDLFVAGPVVVFSWRAEPGWPVDYVSANVGTILGHAAGDFMAGNVHYADLIHPDDIERVKAEVRRASAGPAAFFEHRPYRVRHRDGRWLWLHDCTRIVRDESGSPLGYSGYVLDVSERVGLQEHLRVESEFREALIDAATEGICAGHPCPEPPYVRVTVWNRRLRELTGYSPYDINRLGMFEALIPEAAERARVIARARRALEGEHLRGEEWVVTTRDGQPRTLRVSTSAIPGTGPDGHRSLLAVVEDVTERRQLEETLRQAQRLEALGTLVGGIAHDFNNFLAGMLGNVHLALADADATASPEARARLVAVEQLGEQAATMVRRLLAFGRRDRPSLAPLDLAGFVRTSVEQARAGLSGTCRLEVDLPTEPQVVSGDATQLQQVLLNLLANAADALRGRPAARVTVSLSPVRLEPAFRQARGGLPDGPYARLVVADNGPGIATADLPRVFEPFFTTKPSGKGSGLGLPMVHGIVAGHGGCVHVESEPGLGAAVIVHLPLSAVPVAPARGAPRAVGDLPRGQGELVLVADDEPFMRQMVRDLLVSLGYRCALAADGQEAVELLAQHGESVAAALLDISMPRLGGPDAARRMRVLRPGLPVVYMTGYDRECALDGQDSSDPVLGKPFRVTALAQALHDVRHGCRPD